MSLCDPVLATVRHFVNRDDSCSLIHFLLDYEKQGVLEDFCVGGRKRKAPPDYQQQTLLQKKKLRQNANTVEPFTSEQPKYSGSIVQ